jgi:hypothetical protein
VPLDPACHPRVDFHEPVRLTSCVVASVSSVSPSLTLSYISYHCRNNLPPDIVHEYFEHQEHFSLKRLLARSATKNFDQPTLTVVQTRSDQFIYAIPSLPADRGISSEDSETIEIVLNLVHDRPHTVVIEHLARLRSEASVRGAIQAWAQHDTRNVFLFLVDMSQEHSLDRGTYERAWILQARLHLADLLIF